MNGTSFNRPYIPDEHKQRTGQIEDNIDAGLMSRAMVGAFVIVSVAGGAICLVWAVALKVL
jgi:hypothetical protein